MSGVPTTALLFYYPTRPDHLGRLVRNGMRLDLAYYPYGRRGRPDGEYKVLGISGYIDEIDLQLFERDRISPFDSRVVDEMYYQLNQAKKEAGL